MGDSSRDTTPAPGTNAPIWIFGYGSLMWDPGFAFHCRVPARLMGYHRSYGMFSTRNRGTPETPGMIVSLAPGRQCTGMAYHIQPGREDEALEYLDQREGIDRAHRRARIPLFPVSANGDCGGGAIIHAYTYLPITTYPNYIQGVPLERKAELVNRGRGSTGSSFDYLHNMLETLRELEVPEPELEALLRHVRATRGRG